ncbi:MAG: hypothetical protein ACRD3W_05010 [Terriglobales bacterium]
MALADADNFGRGSGADGITENVVSDEPLAVWGKTVATVAKIKPAKQSFAKIVCCINDTSGK